MQMMETLKLKPHPRNKEFFDDMEGERWKDFIKSIDRRGIVEGIVVTEDPITHELIIVSGHQRQRAGIELGIDKVPCRIVHYPDYNEKLHISREDMILEDLICTNIMQRGVGNVNPMKMAKCIKELERIYGIRQGSAGGNGNNQYTNKELDGNNFAEASNKSQEDLAKQIGIDQRQLQNYKKLNELIPELQTLVEVGDLKSTTAYKIWARLSKEEQEEFFNEIGIEKIKQMTQKQTQSELNKIICEKEQLEESFNELSEKYNKEKNKEPEVVEVDKTDYTQIEKLKKERRELELKVIKLKDSQKETQYIDNPETVKELERLKEQIKDKNEIINKNKKLQNEINENKILISKFVGESSNLKLINSTSENRSKIMNFLKDMSEYDYLSEVFNEIPDSTRKEWARSVYAVFKWSKNILKNIKYDDVLGINKDIVDAEFQID